MSSRSLNVDDLEDSYKKAAKVMGVDATELAQSLGHLDDSHGHSGRSKGFHISAKNNHKTDRLSVSGGSKGDGIGGSFLSNISVMSLLKKKKHHPQSPQEIQGSDESGGTPSTEPSPAAPPQSKPPSSQARPRVSWSAGIPSGAGGQGDLFRQRSITRRTRNISWRRPSHQNRLKNAIAKGGIVSRSKGIEVIHHLASPRDSATSTISDSSMRMDDSLSNALLQTLSKERLCDVQLVGKDDVPVAAPSYLLAAQSEVFEALFYPETKSSAKRTVGLSFAAWDALHATMHFLATRTFPDGLEKQASEQNIRSVCQVYLLGRLFKIESLANQAYRTARLIMNKMPCLVCAAFDECIVSTKLVPSEYNFHSSHDEVKEYALEYMRDTPGTTLMARGTFFLSDASIKEVVCDQEMDVDEHTMFHILFEWVKQDEDNVETGRELVSHIRLAYINTDYLNHTVKKCGFVELSVVEKALKEIEEMLANQSPDEKEHVLVEMAGSDEVNGIYVRMDEDIGLGDEEEVFVKEAKEHENCPDFGLYLFRSTWAISSCVDYSSILYSNESTLHRPPKVGWKAIGGSEPPPICKWNPSKEDREASEKGYVAPNLADVGRNKNKVFDVANGDYESGIERRLTLRTMLNLPSDDDHEDLDYHDDIDDSNKSRDV